MAAIVPAAQAQDARTVVTPTQSVAQADATLAQVDQQRAVVAETFAAEESVCYTKFFVNNCLDKAKEKRRVALVGLRAQEVEAEHFKRAESVARRDADLAERAHKDAEEYARREAQPVKPPRTEEQMAPKAAPKGKSVDQREAEHAARMQRAAEHEAANAEKRSANVQAFEKKQADAARRQEEVAKRVAESRRKAEARAAADAAAEKKRAEAAAAKQ
ncbi:MAG: hypothetical protein ABW202_01620 [Duganella sp.]